MATFDLPRVPPCTGRPDCPLADGCRQIEVNAAILPVGFKFHVYLNEEGVAWAGFSNTGLKEMCEPVDAAVGIKTLRWLFEELLPLHSCVREVILDERVDYKNKNYGIALRVMSDMKWLESVSVSSILRDRCPADDLLDFRLENVRRLTAIQTPRLINAVRGPALKTVLQVDRYYHVSEDFVRQSFNLELLEVYNDFRGCIYIDEHEYDERTILAIAEGARNGLRVSTNVGPLYRAILKIAPFALQKYYDKHTPGTVKREPACALYDDSLVQETPLRATVYTCTFGYNVSVNYLGDAVTEASDCGREYNPGKTLRRVYAKTAIYSELSQVVREMATMKIKTIRTSLPGRECAAIIRACSPFLEEVNFDNDAICDEVVDALIDAPRVRVLYMDWPYYMLMNCPEFPPVGNGASQCEEAYAFDDPMCRLISGSRSIEKMLVSMYIPRYAMSAIGAAVMANTILREGPCVQGRFVSPNGEVEGAAVVENVNQKALALATALNRGKDCESQLAEFMRRSLKISHHQ